MKRRFTLLLAGLCLVGTGGASAATLVMGFEGTADGQSINIGAVTSGPPYVYEEAGLLLTFSSIQAALRDKAAYRTLTFDSDFIDWCVEPAALCQNQAVSLSTASGRAFALQSIDMTAVLEGGNVVITGFLAGGGTVTKTHTLSPFPDAVLEPVAFDSSWTDLTSVTFAAGASTGFGLGMGIDDVTVSVVPLPGAAWLFASGLLLLLRRRRC